jgi:hypothetical protein
VRLKQSAQNISEPLGHHGYFKGEEILAREEAGIVRCGRRNILMKLRIMKIDRAAGFLAVNPDEFPNDFAADAPEPVAQFMAISQVPVSAEAFDAKATVAAWKQKPSYAVIPTQDRMINPDLERFMAKRAQSQVIELPGSHAIFLSHAPKVAALIEKAATAAKQVIVSQCLLL